MWTKISQPVHAAEGETIWSVLDDRTRHRLDRAAAAILEERRLPATSAGPEWHPVDMWLGSDVGAVLFLGTGGYYVASAVRTEDAGWWVNAGGWTSGDLQLQEEIAHPRASGLTRFGGGASGKTRTVVGVASREVAAIRLYASGRVSERAVPAERMFLLGITEDDPITYAIGVDDRGDGLPAPALLL